MITADACIPIAHRAAGVEIKAPVTEVATFEAQDAFGARIALAGDVVDGAAGGVGGENGRRAAAHDLEGLDRLVHAEGLVGVEITERGIVLDGQTVLQEIHRRVAVGGDAAGADVGAGFAAGGFDPEARYVAEGFGDAHRGC